MVYLCLSSTIESKASILHRLMLYWMVTPSYLDGRFFTQPCCLFDLSQMGVKFGWMFFSCTSNTGFREPNSLAKMFCWTHACSCILFAFLMSPFPLINFYLYLCHSDSQCCLGSRGHCLRVVDIWGCNCGEVNKVFPGPVDVTHKTVRFGQPILATAEWSSIILYPLYHAVK